MTELHTYSNRIDDLLGQVEKIVAGLPAEALNWRPIKQTEAHEMNSLAVLATHVAGAARFWVIEVVGGQPINRDRPAEFKATEDDPAALLAMIQQARREIGELLTALDPAVLDSERQLPDRTVPARWAIVHVIDHTALHLGHMQITFQLWNHGQGVDAPRWFNRINNE